MEDDTHLKYSYDTRSHPCHFGCEKDFLNELALHRHVQQLMCEEAQDLSEAIKTCSICSATFPDVLGELVRWEQRHGHVLANTNSLFHCTPCNINFPTKKLFWVICHLLAAAVILTTWLLSRAVCDTP
jgi:hypothetical protein